MNAKGIDHSIKLSTFEVKSHIGKDDLDKRLPTILESNKDSLYKELNEYISSVVRESLVANCDLDEYQLLDMLSNIAESYELVVSTDLSGTDELYEYDDGTLITASEMRQRCSDLRYLMYRDSEEGVLKIYTSAGVLMSTLKKSMLSGLPRIHSRLIPSKPILQIKTQEVS